MPETSGVTFDPDDSKLHIADCREVSLRLRDCRILGALASGRAVATSDLIAAVWPDDEPETSENALRVYLHSLRKLFVDNQIPLRIEVVHKRGYRLVPKIRVAAVVS